MVKRVSRYHPDHYSPVDTVSIWNIMRYALLVLASIRLNVASSGKR
ncbi:hypothetical protein [Tengunoibacter tsumagoiensis]|nr:hypothetical protein [Tengunoibacter tsumagoiensis]